MHHEAQQYLQASILANSIAASRCSDLKSLYRIISRITNRDMKIEFPRQIKIDGILDKIGKSGYDSLTKQEKDFLFKAGDK